MLSGWSTSGKQACPHCMSDSDAFTLPCSGKTSWFDNHRKFLPADHPLRRSRTMFLRGKQVSQPAPISKPGDELLNELDEFGFRPSYEMYSDIINKQICSLTRCGRRRRSIFWELPYWSTNLIRHNLDVMHIEKTSLTMSSIRFVIYKGVRRIMPNHELILFGWVLDPSCIHLQQTGNFRKQITHFDKDARKVLFRWLKEVRFSDGYVSKMARCVDMNKLRMFGMKSHDCHVFMQRLIPVVFKELLPRDVWEALTELSIFFADLTARNVKISDMLRLSEQIPIIMCKLEKIFPPSFFDSMEHLCIHLPYEARIMGPVQFRWMYPFERYLRTLKNTVRNKARVEGSICNAYFVKEAAIFCQHYFSESTASRRRKTGEARESTYVDTDDSELLSIFRNRGKKIGAAKSRWLSNEEYHAISTYVLHNCNEIKPFVSMYENNVRMTYPDMDDASVEAYIQTNLFQWFRQYPINGFNFHTVHDTSFKDTNNSGLQVSGHMSSGNVTEFYAQLEEIVEIEYPGLQMRQVVLFKCRWFHTHPRSGTRVHKKYKIVDVNRKNNLGDYEPFVFPTQASQVVYLTYPTTKRAESDWMHVSTLRRRAYVNDVEPNIEQNTDAFQNNESGPHDISTQFLLTSQNLFDVNVMYDNEIDLNSSESEAEDVQYSSDDVRDIDYESE
ncbi:uncharacterized protein [Primulina eburnea]|uniref:uncharacterized protein n=1 Tax=Primulina eburnea TaxID=1245227 RepID=UPI003C6BDB35